MAPDNNIMLLSDAAILVCAATGFAAAPTDDAADDAADDADDAAAAACDRAGGTGPGRESGADAGPPPAL